MTERLDDLVNPIVNRIAEQTDRARQFPEGREDMNAAQQLIPHEAQAVTPMDLLSQAIEKGAGLEVISQFMDLQERYEKNLARKAFNQAIAAAKAEITPIKKNATGHNNKRYADFAALAKAVDPIISQHELGYRFRTVQDDKIIQVTCIIFHAAGHSEENTLAGPADATGSKNAIQAIGSTLTYLQRYGLTQALGLAASEDDDGKAGGSGETVSDEQRASLQAMIDETHSDIRLFCNFFGIEALTELPASRYDEASAKLQQKARKAKV